MALAATASDIGGTIAKVAFYAGTTLLATDTASPFSFSWANVPVGTYVLKAVATDNGGNQHHLRDPHRDGNRKHRADGVADIAGAGAPRLRHRPR